MIMEMEPEDRNQSCGTCVFHTIDRNNLGQGLCRRYPPQFSAIQAKGPLGTTGIQNLYSFPLIRLSDWGCGEYLPDDEDEFV